MSKGILYSMWGGGFLRSKTTKWDDPNVVDIGLFALTPRLAILYSVYVFEIAITI